MPDYRQFTPGPMAPVPFMPAANVAPQRIQLRPPPVAAPAPVPAGPPPAMAGPYNPFRPGGGFQMGPAGPAPMGRWQPGGVAMPWQVQRGNQTQSMPTPVASPHMTPRPFNGGLMNLGMGMLQGGQNIASMAPHIMQMFGRK